MAQIDIHVGNLKYQVKSDLGEEHLKEVAHLVESKLDRLLQDPSMTVPKAAILAAVEFASQSVQEREQLKEYQGLLQDKAAHILERIERELNPATN